jgi:hypothetical protein
MLRAWLPRRWVAAIGWQVAQEPVSRRELWGYGFWLTAGLVFGVPESWAGLSKPSWPALTDTIGHLEAVWPPTGIIVAILMVLITLAAIRHPLARAGKAARHSRQQAAQPGGALPDGSQPADAQPGGPQPGGAQPADAQPGSRARAGAAVAGQRELAGLAAALPDGPGAMRRPASPAFAPVFAYFPLALCAVAGGSLLAALASSNPFLHGYVIYGLFAFFFVLIPNVAAVCFARRMPFPTLARTVIDLERRWWPSRKIIVIGLVVLMIHLAVARWPSLPLS